MKGRRAAESNESLDQAALRYLARKDRTETQMQKFLQRRGASPHQVQTVVRRMRAHGYLNDEMYARRWAAERMARRPMGRQRLEAELLAQGFASALVDQTLIEIYGQRGERVWAELLLRAKGHSAVSPAPQVRLLRTHGFSEETIEEVVRS